MFNSLMINVSLSISLMQSLILAFCFFVAKFRHEQNDQVSMFTTHVSILTARMT